MNEKSFDMSSRFWRPAVIRNHMTRPFVPVLSYNDKDITKYHMFTCHIAGHLIQEMTLEVGSTGHQRVSGGRKSAIMWGPERGFNNQRFYQKIVTVTCGSQSQSSQSQTTFCQQTCHFSDLKWEKIKTNLSVENGGWNDTYGRSAQCYVRPVARARGPPTVIVTSLPTPWNEKILKTGIDCSFKSKRFFGSK